jgi:chromosome segregation ATPase
MLLMQEEVKPDPFQQRIDTLSQSVGEVRRKMEGLMAENQRLREVVRLAESELRNRRDQVQRLENAIQSLNNNRLEARGRVEHVMEQLDRLATSANRVNSSS